MPGVIYRIAAQEALYGFGDPILDVPILNESLGTYQARICAQCGMRIVDVSSIENLPQTDMPLWYFHAKMIFTLDFLKAAIQETIANPSAFIQFGLKMQPSAQQHSLPIALHETELTFPLFYKGSVVAQQAQRIELTGKEYEWQIQMPAQVMPGHLPLESECGFCSHVIVSISFAWCQYGPEFEQGSSDPGPASGLAAHAHFQTFYQTDFFWIKAHESKR